MDKLKICKDNRVFFGEEEVKRGSVDFTEFLIANLDNEVEIEDGITMEELIHFFYDCRQFIYSYFSEHYEVLRAFLVVKNLQYQYSTLKISKKIHIDEGYITIIPTVDFIVAKEDEYKTNSLAKIIVKLDDQLSLMEDDILTFESEDTRILKRPLKSKISLLDLMKALFEDLTLVIEENITTL